MHETGALVQRRLRWEALERFLYDLLPRCEIERVNEITHHAAATRCRQRHERRFSLTDTVSLDCMTKRGIAESIAQNEHFVRAHVVMP